MNLKIVSPTVSEKAGQKFNALHPMFRLDVPEVPAAIATKLQEAEHLIVVGIGGSTLPLKTFIDAACLNNRVHFLDTVDPMRWKQLAELPRSLYCVVSKSGETLEIKALLAEIIAAQKLGQTLIVTDPAKGSLRQFATEHQIPALEIPSDIGGRFTNFTVFHRAVLERFKVSFSTLIRKANETVEKLKEDPSILEQLYDQVYSPQKANLILWSYGDRLLGLSEWIQQALAESLGKKDKDGRRVGVLPVVLKGPQDQHSVLQLLIDGPQNRALWFFIPPLERSNKTRNLGTGFELLNKIGLSESLNILADATAKTFEERVHSPETSQPVTRFELQNLIEDVAIVTVIVQALVEYAGQRMNLNPFDQPGVERGKQLAREIISKF